MCNLDNLTKMTAAVLLSAAWTSGAWADPARTTARALVADWKNGDREIAAGAYFGSHSTVSQCLRASRGLESELADMDRPVVLDQQSLIAIRRRLSSRQDDSCA